MDYEIKPRVKNPVYKKIKQEKREKDEESARIEAEEAKEILRQRRLGEKKQEKLSKEVVTAVENNTSGLKDVLEGLKVQIAKIELEIPEMTPEYLGTDKIVSSISQNTDSISSRTDELRLSIEKLAQSVKSIKIDVKQPNLDGITHSLNASMNQNSERLSAILEDLYNQIALIKFESPEPISEWDFDFIRNRSGLTEKITAKGKRTLN